MSGKQIRLGRICKADRRTVIVPIDQSITTGPIAGLERIDETIRSIVAGQPDAIVMHRGPVLSGLWKDISPTGLIIHLSAGTQLTDQPQVKALVGSVKEAVKLGADGISVHISLGLGTERDRAVLADLGNISDECVEWGMPLLAMMYVYGSQPEKIAENIIHAARIGGELGADLIKVNYPGSLKALERLITTSFVPIVIAGGAITEDGRETLKLAEEVIAAGAAGVCIGRNVFQHKYPANMARALTAIVHHGVTAKEAYEEFIGANVY
ncbi:MAG TPA: 2-amino-3,7-dideoxy-D-threo-hept-6-ulosonate synthase [Ktedonosporobacter sp.]|jgi:class I fructose-bisphosphate aldolase|nr:2-amino-3,7-dideoxy-D-threo-hept-6-ulosonate synthase [Ktedonosporobacter sp.]